MFLRGVILLLLVGGIPLRADPPVKAQHLAAFLSENEKTAPAEIYPKVATYLQAGSPEQKDQVIRYLWHFTDIPVEAQRDLAKVLLQITPNGAAPISSGEYDTERPEISANAGFVLSRLHRIDDAEVRKQILTFIDAKLEGPIPTELHWTQSVEQTEAERLKILRGIRRAHANLSLSNAQRYLVESIPRSPYDRAEVRPVVERAVARYPEPHFRITAIKTLIEVDALRPEIAKELAAWQPAPAAKKMAYSLDLLKAAKAGRESHPAYESFVLDLLTHPNAQVRSEAIDVLRAWTALKDPMAIAKLAAMRPSLTGFSANVAEELTENAKLPEARRLPVRARALGEIRKVEERRFDQHPTFLHLMEDLFIEARDFRLPEDQRARLEEVRRRLWNIEDPNRFNALDAFSWGSREVAKDKIISTPEDTSGAAAVAVSSPTQGTLPHYLHSMPDFTLYLENRLGPKLVEQVQQGEVALSVWGGELKTLLAEKKLDPAKLRRLPSPYSEWGIEKYLDLSGEKPRVYFVIPPITEYVQHYDSMLKNIGSFDHTVELNKADRERYRADSIDAVKKLYGELNGKKMPEIVALGYDYAIPDFLKSRPEWRVLEQKRVSADCNGCGVHGTYLLVEHSQLKGEPIPMLLVSSDRSLWGEGSSFLAEGITSHNPKLKDFWFFGSAGAPGLRNLYGVSVPDYFLNRDGSMVVDGNAFNVGITSNRPVGLNYTQGPGGWKNTPSSQRRGSRHSLNGIGPDGLVAEGRVTAITHTTHGQSHSPAEQTRHSVSEIFTDNQAHTVDVETNLLALVVGRHNFANPAQPVRFGVAHVITDIPASNSHTFDSGRSLSEVDRGRKANAREVALTVAFDALEQRLLARAFQTGGEAAEGISHFSGWSHNSQHSEYSLSGAFEKHSRNCNETLAELSHFSPLPPRNLSRSRR